MSPEDLLDAVEAAAERSHAQYRVMVNVTGRWTGIKGIHADDDSGILFIDTED